MKKVFLLLMLAIASLNIFAGPVTKVKIDSSSVTESKGGKMKMDSAVYSDGKNFLKSVEVGASNGYDVVVAQQKVYAIQYLLVGILCAIFLFLFFRYYAKMAKNESNVVLPALICLVGSVWTAIIFSMHYGQIVQGFINPDYAAIQDIIKMTKNLISK